MGKNFVENTKKLTDEEIVSLINSGDFELLKVIIERYSSVISFYVHKYCPQCDREDAIQEATFALYSAVKNFKAQKASFSTFASLCIKRSVISNLKSEKRLKNIPQELKDSLEDVSVVDINTPEDIVVNNESYKTLTENIKLELSNFEYKVLQLYVSENSYAKIAEKLDVSEKSVDNALGRIRKKLKQNKG